MTTSRARRLLCIVTAGGLLSAALVGGTATAAIAGQGCAPVVVLAFRGSGQLNVDPVTTGNAGSPYNYAGSNLVTNGWEGATLQRLLVPFANTVLGDGLRADSVPVIGVGPDGGTEALGYPAVDVALTSLAPMIESVENGAAAGEAIIKQVKIASAACSIQPKFIALGYSQGAMAARILAQLNPTDVVGVVTLGDPLQRPDAAGNTGAASSGDGGLRWSNPGYAAKWDAFYDLDTDTTSLCHSNDPVCDLRWDTIWRALTGSVEQHLNYFTAAYDTAASVTEAATSAAELADMAHGIVADAGATDPTAAPLARVSASVMATAGVPTVVSAVGSSRAAQYEFDLDGDG
ncbi:cutinase family protein, partial [Cryobacterium roopkundense]